MSWTHSVKTNNLKKKKAGHCFSCCLLCWRNSHNPYNPVGHLVNCAVYVFDVLAKSGSFFALN